MTTPVHRFRMAMARNLGRIVSSELAAQLEAEVFGRQPSPLPDKPEDAQYRSHDGKPAPTVAA